jgi:hypothetical protein
VPSGQALFSKDQRKYAGWVTVQQDDGSYVRLAANVREADYFRSWHWFYRFVMAGRTVDGFRMRMWDMARMRIRDIRSAPWRPAAGLAHVPDGSGGKRPAAIGDVYSSERAMALLLRWHIRAPEQVVSGGHAGVGLTSALNRAGIVTTSDPTRWTTAQQRALLRGIRDEVDAAGPQDLIDSMREVDHWPTWATGANPRGFRLTPRVGRLRDTSRSFRFDASGLPPTPQYS